MIITDYRTKAHKEALAKWEALPKKKKVITPETPKAKSKIDYSTSKRVEDNSLFNTSVCLLLISAMAV